LEFPPVIHGCVNIKSSKVRVIPADSSIFVHHLSWASVNDWLEKIKRYTSQPNRQSWFAKTTGMSADLIARQTDYWFGNQAHLHDEFPAAYALLHVAYDIIDRVKLWESQAGIDGEKEFVALCARLKSQYDTVEELHGPQLARATHEPAGKIVHLQVPPPRYHEMNPIENLEGDTRLAPKALEREPENPHDWFCLAKYYRDAGRIAEAAQAFAKRASMGGSGEEAWNARLEEARCLLKLGDEGGFLSQAVAAFNERPDRAEPLFDLARFYREKGMNDASVLFSEAGLAIPRPGQDSLFVEHFVYSAGLEEEYSVAANYSRDAARKDRGFAACNWLALNREIPRGSRDLARSNLFYYVQPASAVLPSFATGRVGFTPPNGYRPANPSVARLGGAIVLVQRAVNYTLADDGQYRTPNDAPIHTRNFLLRLTPELETQWTAEILPPADWPEPSYNLVQGFEDLRPFAWHDALWGCATVRQLTPEGWCEQVLARIDGAAGVCRLSDWRVLHPPGPKLHEKNWMPRVKRRAGAKGDEKLQFIYLCEPTRVIDDQARTISETKPVIAADRFRGCSQTIAFQGGWLALIHEVQPRASYAERFYSHRFVWFDAADKLARLSRPFFFQQKRVEFAAGLAWHLDGKRLLISYSVVDRESFIATVDAADVAATLADVDQLPSGRTSLTSQSIGAIQRVTFLPDREGLPLGSDPMVHVPSASADPPRWRR
jgi:hypothetical protein